MEGKSGIYAIINKVNGKRYVGSAVNLNRRKNVHWNDLSKNSHHSEKLQRAWNKHGQKNFEFFILELIGNEFLTMREQHWINYFDSSSNGYNCQPIAGSNLGNKHKESTKKLMAIAATGRKHSEETKAKISAIQMGRRVSENVKKRASETHKGRKHSKEHIEKVAAAHRGHKHSEESKRKMSLAHIGRKHKPEHAKKRSDALKLAWKKKKEIQNATFSA